MKRMFSLFLLLPFLSFAQTGTITTIAGTGTAGYGGDGGLATAASVRNPSCVTFDISGNIYIADDSNHCVRKITPSGIITTVAGTGTLGFSGDGGAATAARLHSPSGVATDRAGNLYIADRFNNRIRKVTPSGIITTLAGTGSGGFGGDSSAATAAQLYNPYGIATDTGGNVYIADLVNHRVRKVSPSGIIYTIAGTGTPGYSGDYGVATGARLNQPIAVAADAAGNLVIADWGNNCVRRINSFGIINTIAGTGTGSFSGDGAPATAAELSGPIGVAVDATGFTYIADSYNNRVRRITPAGIISTIAGNGIAGYSGDGGQATAAQLNYPVGVATSTLGNAYITELNGNRVRSVLLNHVPYFTAGLSNSITVCEGTSSNPFNTQVAATDSEAGQTLTWSLVASPAHGSLSGLSTTAAATGFSVIPSGLSYTPSFAFHGNDTFKVGVFDGYGSDTMSVLVLVNPLPLPGYIMGADSVCPLGYESMMDTAGTHGGTWRHTGSFITLDSVTGLMRGITAGSETITYSVTNSCGTATATLAVTVNPAPISGAIYGPDSVCIGSTINLHDTTGTPGGVWSSSDTSVARVSSSGVVTAIAGGPVAIYYNAFTNCGSAPAYHPIFVSPYAGTITGADTVCPGDTIQLGNIVTTGTWSSSATGIATISSLGIVYGNVPGTAVISYTVPSFSCGTGYAMRPIVVKSPPSAGSISGLVSICSGTTSTLSSSVPGGVWSNSTSSVATVDSVSGVALGVGAGSTTISYTVTNSCASAVAMATLLVTTVPAVAPITGADSVCLGASVTALSSPASGTWNLSNANAALGTGTSTSRNISGIAIGYDTLSYAVTNTCGTTTVLQLVKIVGVPAPGTISGPSAVCEGSAITLSSSGSGGSWSSRNVALATIGSSSGIAHGVAAGNDTINYSVSNVCGSAIAIFSLVVNPLPSHISISGSSSVCPGAGITLTPSVTGGTWAVTNTHASISASGVVTGTTPGTDTIAYTFSNSCGAVTINYPVTVIGPPVVGGITGPLSVCTGASITLTDSVSGGAWASSTPSLATVVSSSGVVHGVAAGTDTISYTVAGICATTTITRLLTITPLPNAGVINGLSSVCPGDSISLTDSISGGAWTVSNAHATISGGVVTGIVPGSDTVYYTVSTTCGTAVARKVISIGHLPVVGALTGPVVVCPGEMVVFGDSTSGGTWAASNGFAFVTGGTVSGITPGVDTIYYTVYNACGSTTVSRTVTVSTMVMPSVSTLLVPDSNICVGDLVTFVATPVNGGSAPVFQWRRSATLIGTGNPFSYSPTAGDAIHCVLISNEQCALVDTVAGDTITFHTNPPVIPVASIVASPADTATYPGEVITFTANLTLCGSAPLYQWFLNGTPVSGATNVSYFHAVLKKDTVYCVVSCNIPCALSPFNHTNTIVVDPVFLGVADNSLDIDMAISPNPNTGSFNLSGRVGGNNGEAIHVSVTDMTGKVMYTCDVQPVQGVLHRSIQLPQGIPSGYYLVRVVTASGARFLHMIKTE